MFIVFLPSSGFAQSLPSLPNLVYWLDGKDINGDGSSVADGALISTWVDKSPSGQNATLVGGTTAPYFDADAFDTTNQCGGALRFGDGTRRQLSAPDVFGGTTGEMTTFIVTREINRRNHTVWSINAGANNATSNIAGSRILMHLPWGNGRGYFDFNGCCNGATTRVQGPYPAVGSISITTAQSSITNNNTYIRNNGALVDLNVHSSTSSTISGLNLGSLGGSWFDGHIAELIMYKEGLTPAQVAQVEEYLTNKWVDCDTVDLEITKQVFTDSSCSVPLAAGNTANEGDTLYYCIEATNNGPDDATNFSLTDNLPAGVTIINGNPSQGTFTP